MGRQILVKLFLVLASPLAAPSEPEGMAHPRKNRTRNNLQSWVAELLGSPGIRKLPGRNQLAWFRFFYVHIPDT